MMSKLDTKISIDLKTLIIVGGILLVVIFGGWRLYQNRVNTLKEKYETEVKLKSALLDTVKYYKNKENEWTAEKLTIQASLKNLEKINGELTASQRELLKRVLEIEKNNSIIAAALIEANVKIDKLLHKGETDVDTLNKNVIFSDSTKNFTYRIKVGKVLPAFKDTVPTLEFQHLYLPNKQFVEFHWKNDKKKGYPVSFSVSNSNEYFKVANIDSYAIPKLQKDAIDPNGWQKLMHWTTKNGKMVITIGVAGVVGIGAGILFF